MADKEFIRNRLAEAIKKSGLKKIKVAEIAGMSHVSLYRILNGDRNLNNTETIMRLAEALKLPVGYFFGEIDYDDAISGNKVSPMSLNDIIVPKGWDNLLYELSTLKYDDIKVVEKTLKTLIDSLKLRQD